MLLSRLGSRETAIWHPRSFAKPRKTPQRAPDLTPHTQAPVRPSQAACSRATPPGRASRPPRVPDSTRQAALRHEPLSRTRQPVAPPCEASGAEAVPFQRVSERKARPSEGAALTPCAAFLRLFAAKSSLLYHPAPRREALRQQRQRAKSRPDARAQGEAARCGCLVASASDRHQLAELAHQHHRAREERHAARQALQGAAQARVSASQGKQSSAVLRWRTMLRRCTSSLPK